MGLSILAAFKDVSDGLKVCGDFSEAGVVEAGVVQDKKLALNEYGGFLVKPRARSLAPSRLIDVFAPFPDARIGRGAGAFPLILLRFLTARTFEKGAYIMRPLPRRSMMCY